MNKFEINQNLFKRVLDGVKHSIAVDDSRPVLKNIQIKIKKNILTAYSVDGYRASRVKANLGDVDYGEFVFYIKPITIKATKRGIENVVVECDNETASLEVVTDYGRLKYTFVQPNSDFINVDAVYEGAAEHDRESYLNPRYLVEAAKSIQAISVSNSNYKLIIESKSDITKPIILRGEDNGIINEQLILPIRVVK